MTQNELLEGYINRTQLATALGITGRTVQRYESLPSGLPSVVVGGRKLYRVESVRRWLESRERNPNPRRAAT